jgi:hypothetical protein
MYYETNLTIPPNTPVTAPATRELQITKGVIQHAEVFMPKGAAGLVHGVVYLWERQLWPSNPDGYFTSDGQQIPFDEDLEIVDPPYVLELRGWNDDDTYPHDMILRVQVIPADQLLRNVLTRLGLGPSGPVSREGD